MIFLNGEKHVKQDSRSYRSLNTYTKLMRAAESVTSRTSRKMAEHDLTISQFGVLEALLHKGAMCQRDVAAKILKSTGNITLVIDNLEKQGLVRRERSVEDRRYYSIVLTDTGRDVIEKAFAEVEAAVVTEMSALTEEEQVTLGQLCKKLGLREGKKQQ